MVGSIQDSLASNGALLFNVAHQVVILIIETRKLDSFCGVSLQS